MRAFRLDLLVLALGVCLVTPTVVLTRQSGEATTDPSVESRLTLGFRPVTLVYSPTLSAADGPHDALLSARDAAPGRVRVGQLRAHPLLRIGTLDGSELSDDNESGEGTPQRRGRRYDLWLTRVATGWTLEAHRLASDDETAAMLVGTIPLTHAATSDAVDAMSAALVPTSDDTGQLVLSWGRHRWTADYDFADPPANRGQGGGGADGRRDFDSDTSAIALAVTLAERHESAMVLPDESRISVLFWQTLNTDHDDFTGIALAEEGDIVRLTQAAVLRLRTEIPLQFGSVAVPTDNLAPDFPGSYGLWLKRVDNGWRLVFNNEPDAWGTQHNAEHDAAEVDLTYSRSGQSTRPLGATLIPTGEGRGKLVIHWGLHEWSADFTTGV